MRNVKFAEVFHRRQIFQGNFFRIILINICNNSADAFGCGLVTAFKIDDNIVFERKQIEVLVQILDDVNDEISALAFVIETLNLVCEQNLQKLFAQIVVPLRRRLVGIGTIAGFAERRKILRKIMRADLNQCNDIFFAG